ncbi:MAG: DUF368 domain-containing protein [Candidatus Izemoplasmataceae bacterium]
MKTRLEELLKGIGIGIANIIPGFSGGTMAVVFGLYEKLIYAFSHFFETPVKIVKELWAVILGVAVGILIAVFGITLLLDLFPVPTILFFAGLIIGSIPKIQERANLLSEEKAPKIGLFVGMMLLIGLTFLKTAESNQIEITTLFFIGLFFIGALGSASMVVPGVSGSLIFLVFGYYDYILDLASTFIKGAATFDFQVLWSTILPIVILGTGIVLGVVLIAKLIEKLILTHKTLIYGFITGLILASPLAMIINMQREYPTQVSDASFLIWGVAGLMAVLGFIGATHLGRMEEPEKIETLQETL